MGKCEIFKSFRGSAPDPAGGLQRPPDPQLEKGRAAHGLSCFARLAIRSSFHILRTSAGPISFSLLRPCMEEGFSTRTRKESLFIKVKQIMPSENTRKQKIGDHGPAALQEHACPLCDRVITNSAQGHNCQNNDFNFANNWTTEQEQKGSIPSRAETVRKKETKTVCMEKRTRYARYTTMP